MIPTDPAERKQRPITTGVLDYFPDALAEVAYASWVGNEQHNPGERLHWAKEKSTDEADCITRHLIQRGTRDSDGVRHSAKVAWRALALLQREIEAEQADDAADDSITAAAHRYHTDLLAKSPMIHTFGTDFTPCVIPVEHPLPHKESFSTHPAATPFAEQWKSSLPKPPICLCAAQSARRGYHHSVICPLSA